MKLLDRFFRRRQEKAERERVNLKPAKKVSSREKTDWSGNPHGAKLAAARHRHTKRVRRQKARMRRG